MAAAKQQRRGYGFIFVSKLLTQNKFLQFIGLLSAVVLLANCGFRPLYDTQGTDSAAYELSAIAIVGVSDRLDQNLRNDLIQRLTPFGEPALPTYNLIIKADKFISALAIQSNSTITRYNLLVTASFVLVDRENDLPIFRGGASAVGSYDAVRSDFATLTAEQDSARRTVREVAEEIRAQLGAFFSRRQANTE
jgi:LPS-assembly lipoprotein